MNSRQMKTSFHTPSKNISSFFDKVVV